MIGWGVDCYKISRDATGKYKDARDSITVSFHKNSRVVSAKEIVFEVDNILIIWDNLSRFVLNVVEYRRKCKDKSMIMQ